MNGFVIDRRKGFGRRVTDKKPWFEMKEITREPYNADSAYRWKVDYEGQYGACIVRDNLAKLAEEVFFHTENEFGWNVPKGSRFHVLHEPTKLDPHGVITLRWVFLCHGQFYHSDYLVSMEAWMSAYSHDLIKTASEVMALQVIAYIAKARAGEDKK